VVNIVFTNLPGTTYGGTRDGYTTATVGTTSTGTGGLAGQLLICDDEAHTTNVPSSVLPYDFSTINTASSTITNARFTPANSGASFANETQTQLYEEAAIILYNFGQLVNPTAQVIGQYQYALWNLMNGVTTISGVHIGTFTSTNDGSTTQANTDNAAVATIQLTAQHELLNQNSSGVGLTGSQLAAQQALDAKIYSELRIYTPTSTDASNQEWLQLVATPEPATIGVAGLLLFGMGFVYRRRKLQARAQTA
jgi:hypothetical protein